VVASSAYGQVDSELKAGWSLLRVAASGHALILISTLAFGPKRLCSVKGRDGKGMIRGCIAKKKTSSGSRGCLELRLLSTSLSMQTIRAVSLLLLCRAAPEVFSVDKNIG